MTGLRPLRWTLALPLLVVPVPSASAQPRVAEAPAVAFASSR